MIRFLHMIAVSALVASALYAYSVKYDTLYYAEQVAKTKAKVHKERDAIAVLKAEWQLLNRPDRLQAIADKHLGDLQPLSVHQLARLADLPNRPPPADEIGRKLEALGLLEPTETPKGKQPGDARTPSTRTPGR
jgi:cell division protein FtsL